MLNFGSWSFLRVATVSICWVLLTAAFGVLRIYLNMQRFESDGAGVAAFSVALGPVVLWLFGVPFVLFTIWLVLKVRARMART